MMLLPSICDVCNRWVHIRCNSICKKTYRGLKKDPTPWFCKSCMQKEIPFSNINNTEYIHLTKDLKVEPKKITQETIFEILNLFSDNEGFPNGVDWCGGQFGQNGEKLHENDKIGILGSKQWEDKPIFWVVGGIPQSPPARGNPAFKYYTTEQFKENGFDKHNNQMTLLHLNISSLPYHIDEFTGLLSDLKINFRSIGIMKSRVPTKKDPMNNINIPGYNTEHTPTKSDKGGALLYISKELHYKSRNDLKLYKDKNLESVFIEVLSKSDKNTIIGLYTSTQIWQ